MVATVPNPVQSPTGIQSFWAPSTTGQQQQQSQTSVGAAQLPGWENLWQNTFTPAYSGLPGMVDNASVSPWLMDAGNRQNANQVAGLAIPAAFQQSQGYNPTAVQNYVNPTLDAQLAELSKWKDYSKSQELGNTAGQAAKLGALTGSQGLSAIGKRSTAFENAWAPTVASTMNNAWGQGLQALQANTGQTSAGVQGLLGAGSGLTSSNVAAGTLGTQEQQAQGYQANTLADVLSRLNPASWGSLAARDTSNASSGTTSQQQNPGLGQSILGTLGLIGSLFKDGGSVPYADGGSVKPYAPESDAPPHDDAHFVDKVSHAFHSFHKLRRHASSGGKEEPAREHRDAGGQISDPVGGASSGTPETWTPNFGKFFSTARQMSGLFSPSPVRNASYYDYPPTFAPYYPPHFDGGGVVDPASGAGGLEMPDPNEGNPWYPEMTVTPAGGKPVPAHLLGSGPLPFEPDTPPQRLGGPAAPPAAPSAAPAAGGSFWDKFQGALGKLVNPRTNFDPNDKQNQFWHNLMALEGSPTAGFGKNAASTYWKQQEQNMRMAELTGQMPNGQQTLAGARNPAMIEAEKARSEEAQVRIKRDEAYNQMRMQMQRLVQQQSLDYDQMVAMGVMSKEVAEQLKKNLASFQMPPPGSDFEYDLESRTFKPRKGP